MKVYLVFIFFLPFILYSKLIEILYYWTKKVLLLKRKKYIRTKNQFLISVNSVVTIYTQNLKYTFVIISKTMQ